MPDDPSRSETISDWKQRRLNLIQKQYSGGLSEQEREDLRTLNEWMASHLENDHPDADMSCLVDPHQMVLGEIDDDELADTSPQRLATLCAGSVFADHIDSPRTIAMMCDDPEPCQEAGIDIICLTLQSDHPDQVYGVQFTMSPDIEVYPASRADITIGF
jgi:hypothetical protein